MHLEDHDHANFGGRNRGSLEIQLEAVIGRVWRYTWRACSCEMGGRNRASLDGYLEAVDGRRAGC